MHPTLLAELGVEAVVHAAPDAISRTGRLRAVAWNIWEAPLTTSIFANSGQAASLLQAFDVVLRQSTRLHLLLQLAGGGRDAFRNELTRFLDRVGDYRQRGWVRVETAGQAAAELSRSANKSAA